MRSWKADVTRFLLVHPQGPGAALDLTDRVNEIVYQSEVQRGLCYLFTPHRETTLELAGGPVPAVAAVAAAVAAVAQPDPVEPPRNQLSLLVVDRRLFLAPGQRVMLREVPGQQPAGAAPRGLRRRVLIRVLDDAASGVFAVSPTGGEIGTEGAE